MSNRGFYGFSNRGLDYACSGGIVTVVNTATGLYAVHTFLVSEALIVNAPVTVGYLMVAGGGGQGYTGLILTGGGGGGGYLTNIVSINVGAYPVIIGAGGTCNYNGSDTTWNGLTATGGGKSGESFAWNDGENGYAGGCGGGAASDYYYARTGGAGSQGGAGGNSQKYGSKYFSSGGGGGGGGNGYNAVAGTAGQGGIGYLSSISGVATYYCGGGGGGNYLEAAGNPTYALGGLGGGGYGGKYSTSIGFVVGSSGTPNTGGGSGSSTYGGLALYGGSGIVIIRYRIG